MEPQFKSHAEEIEYIKKLYKEEIKTCSNCGHIDPNDAPLCTECIIDGEKIEETEVTENWCCDNWIRRNKS